MQQFQIHTIESAPEKSKAALEGLKQTFGLVPNVAATMAESPALLNAFVDAFVNFHGSSFSETEKQVLLLTNAVTLNCAWTIAFHSTIALRQGVSEQDVRAIRDVKSPGDSKYAALSALTKALIEKKGHVTEADRENFAAAGYSQEQSLEVIAGIAISTMAATTGNMANTPIEAPFQPQAWTAVTV